jgi:putative ABC transport system permease protein
MLFGEMIAIALQSIRANLFRGFLTMLGIIIGVGSVITMVALGSGAQRAVDEQIDSLGASILSIRSSGVFSHGVSRGGTTLTIADAEALSQRLEMVTDIVPEVSRQIQLKLGNKNRNLRVVGTRSNFADVHRYELENGRMFTMSDDSSKHRVAILGNGVPGKLDATAQAMIGQNLYIQGIAFEVIGIFKEKGRTGWRNVDEQVWIPLDTAHSRVFGTRDLDLISARIIPGLPVEQALVEIERVLRHEHQISPGANNDFSIGDPRQFFNIRQAATDVFAYLLASIASISLIVGGIGIMNIMLVTVTERTREIGIRKALGATRFNILMQFLVEAMVLCLIGGGVGVALGAGIASIMTRMIGWQTVVSPTAIGIAFLFSAGIGLFFGIWPASKAARLDPIEALRYE